MIGRGQAGLAGTDHHDVQDAAVRRRVDGPRRGGPRLTTRAVPGARHDRRARARTDRGPAALAAPDAAPAPAVPIDVALVLTVSLTGARTGGPRRCFPFSPWRSTTMVIPIS